MQHGGDAPIALQPSASWDHKFMGLALHIAGWSKDRSRRVGAVIVGPGLDVRATGYNGFPRGVDDDGSERHTRPAKYAWTEHAERNAIYNAARAGTATSGCTMYVPWYPCIDCARAVVQAGIAELVAVQPNRADPTWGEQFAVVEELFAEVSVALPFRVRFVDLHALGLVTLVEGTGSIG